MIRFICRVLTILFLLTGAFLSYAYYLYYLQELKSEIVLIIPKNTSTPEIANILEAAEVVDSSAVFNAFAYLHLQRKKYIQPGEYKFERNDTLSKIFGKILYGERYVRHITFPEGYTNFQIVNSLREAYGLEGDVVLPLPEGSLMPDTYNYYYGEARVFIISAMTKEMQEFLESAWQNRAENLSVTNKQDALILASIIEKETRISEERKIVSSVFHNRLRIGMPLQADPTVIYGLKNGDTDYDYKLTKDDMKHNSNYNTYVNRGLPPSPICNPSRESIIAALHPDNTNYLYFVANGDGGHSFSTNYDAHRRNIRRD